MIDSPSTILLPILTPVTKAVSCGILIVSGSSVIKLLFNKFDLFYQVSPQGHICPPDLF